MQKKTNIQRKSNSKAKADNKTRSKSKYESKAKVRPMTRMSASANKKVKDVGGKDRDSKKKVAQAKEKVEMKSIGMKIIEHEQLPELDTKKPQEQSSSPVVKLKLEYPQTPAISPVSQPQPKRLTLQRVPSLYVNILSVVPKLEDSQLLRTEQQEAEADKTSNDNDNQGEKLALIEKYRQKVLQAKDSYKVQKEERAKKEKPISKKAKLEQKIAQKQQQQAQWNKYLSYSNKLKAETQQQPSAEIIKASKDISKAKDSKKLTEPKVYYSYQACYDGVSMFMGLSSYKYILAKINEINQMCEQAENSKLTSHTPTPTPSKPITVQDCFKKMVAISEEPMSRVREKLANYSKQVEYFEPSKPTDGHPVSTQPDKPKQTVFKIEQLFPVPRPKQNVAMNSPSYYIHPQQGYACSRTVQQSIRPKRLYILNRYQSNPYEEEDSDELMRVWSSLMQVHLGKLEQADFDYDYRLESDCRANTSGRRHSKDIENILGSDEEIEHGIAAGADNFYYDSDDEFNLPEPKQYYEYESQQQKFYPNNPKRDYDDHEQMQAIEFCELNSEMYFTKRYSLLFEMEQLKQTGSKKEHYWEEDEQGGNIFLDDVKREEDYLGDNCQDLALPNILNASSSAEQEFNFDSYFNPDFF